MFRRVVAVMGWVLLGMGLTQEVRGAGTVVLSPSACCDGQFTVVSAGGQPVWRNTTGNSFLYFDVPGSFTFTPGTPVYLQVLYFDEGFGVLRVEYDSTAGSATADKYRRSEVHTHSSRLNTASLQTNYHQLQLPALSGRQNGGADFRLSVSGSGGVPQSIRRVVVQNVPFEDPQFQRVLARPWAAPYAGPTRDDADRSTLEGRVMVGYQGWFRTPNDLEDKGWSHWVRNGVVAPTNFTVDMWPDLTGHAPHELVPAGNLTTQSGAPAQLFSSTTEDTVHRHFRWMRKYNIDGAFLQRFVTRSSSGAYGNSEWVLNSVRRAAHLEGRIWAIEYDISALSDADSVEVMTNDWRWLVDQAGILQDSRYAYEGSRPVVFIWGLPFPDRGISKTNANAIVDFFKNDPVYGGNYVIGGIPSWWRTMPDWNDHFQRYHGALAWMPQNAAAYLADKQQLEAWGIDYFPHVWPGFSWSHLKQLAPPAQYTPRGGGSFYWQKIHQALGSGSKRLFIGMFDEYDEGTAIMPMTDDPPAPEPTYGQFINNEGRPPDWWMTLTGEARDMLVGHRPYSATLPAESGLGNRANIGAEAFIDLGTTNRSAGLTLVPVPDGDTSAGTQGGRDCRFNTDPASDRHFYFRIDDGFLPVTGQAHDVTIDVEYFDRGGSATVALEYDGVGGAYTVHPKSITTTGSGLWRVARFNIADGTLDGRQNNSSDFRVRTSASTVHLDRVWLWLPEEGAPTISVHGLVAPGSVWKYSDTGIRPGSGWTAVGFNDSGWASGRARLGYGDNEVTPISFGTSSTNKHVSYYFRHTFEVPDRTQLTNLIVLLSRDDGAVVYLNGVELFRDNMPVGVVDNVTLAAGTVNGADEQTFFQTVTSSSLLVNGLNVVAVEVHQVNRTSSDLGIDLELQAIGPPRDYLFVERMGTQLRLSWPASLTPYRLEGSPRLGAGAVWSTVAGSTTVTNGRRVAMVPVSGLQRFFRLKAD